MLEKDPITPKEGTTLPKLVKYGENIYFEEKKSYI